MKKLVIAMGLTLATGAAQAANNIDTLQNLAQDQFRLFSEDLGSALSYKAVAPAEPLGLTGFDIGIEVTATEMSNADKYADLISSGDFPTTLPVPKLHLHKGLPFGFDVGAFMSSIPSTNIELVGYELRYAILKGGVAMPALAIRATHTELSGVDQLDFSTTGYELSISKGFAMFTPYATIGTVNSTSTPLAEAKTAGLKEEDFNQSKTAVGVNINLGLSNFAFEADKTGDASTTSVKWSLRW